MNSSPYPKTQHPSGRLPEKATTAAGIKPEASAQEGKKGRPGTTNQKQQANKNEATRRR
jgi:hypothetical protein